MASVSEFPKELIADLIDAKLPWPDTKRIMSAFKDPGRFETVVEILQEKVEWDEQILMPLGEHLYVVQKGSERPVKCDCGHEFGPYTENWKLNALIYVRDTTETLQEIYPGPKAPNPDLQEIREFICPGCGTLLEVEAVPPGHPLVFDFLPDLEGFYEGILGKSLPTG